MRTVAFITLIFVMIGCAARPSSIQPAVVSRDPYTSMPCITLNMQIDQEIRNLETLSGEQLSARNWDIAVNLFILPGIGALTGDQEEEIAQAKGRILVMQEEYVARCVEN